MKKSNVLVTAAVAGLFAVSAYADNHKVEAPEHTTKEACKKASKENDWKDNKCWTVSKAECASKEGAGCKGSEGKKEEKKN